MANLLIFDPRRSCAALLRSTLRAQGHRVGTAVDSAELTLKLQTGLFDGLLFVADRIDPALGQIDASGLTVAMLAGGRIEATFPDGRRVSRPWRLSTIGDLADRLAGPAAAPERPAVVDAAGRELRCRATARRLPSVLLEPEAGSEELFAGFFEGVGEAPFGLAAESLAIGPARLLYPERNLAGAIERAAVTIL